MEPGFELGATRWEEQVCFHCATQPLLQTFEFFIKFLIVRSSSATSNLRHQTSCSAPTGRSCCHRPIQLHHPLLGQRCCIMGFHDSNNQDPATLGHSIPCARQHRQLCLEAGHQHDHIFVSMLGLTFFFSSIVLD